MNLGYVIYEQDGRNCGFMVDPTIPHGVTRKHVVRTAIEACTSQIVDLDHPHKRKKAKRRKKRRR